MIPEPVTVTPTVYAPVTALEAVAVIVTVLFGVASALVLLERLRVTVGVTRPPVTVVLSAVNPKPTRIGSWSL